MKAIIETENLTKLYGGRAAVSSLNMHVQQGDIYGFIGRNGSGKSTTLKMLCGLASPTQGSIRIFGKPVSDEGTRKRIGALVETPGLEPGRSAYENMYLKALLMGIVEPEKQIQELLALTGLKNSKKSSEALFHGHEAEIGDCYGSSGRPGFAYSG